MRYTKTMLTVAVSVLGTSAALSAQTRSSRAGGDATAEPPALSATADTETRRVLGLLVSLSGNARDTLGVLVSSVVPRGAADRAGISEGNRIAEVNGIGLRVEPEEVGQDGTERLVTRALVRHLRALRPGDPVALRVFAGGRYRTVHLQAAGAAVLQSASTEPPAPTLEGSPAAGPTLATVMESLGRIQTQLAQLTRSGEPTGRDASRSLPGLRVSTIDDDLAQYFGEGSEQGLLVLEADGSWSPLRSGDVIMLVDGEQPDPTRLRSALDAHREARVDLLRRKRRMTVIVLAAKGAQ